MPLMDHLGELRRRMTIVLVSVLVTAVIVYFATPTLIDMMMDPIRGALPEGTRLTVLTALGGFTIRFKVAIFFGIIICTPIIIWEAMGFFLPALKPKERKWVVPTVGAMVGLFFLGMVTKRANATGALIGMAVSVLVQFIVAKYTPVYLLLYTTVGFITCFVVGYLASLLFPTSKSME